MVGTGPWTAAEHANFEVGVKLYGKASWKLIAEKCIKTRTPEQVRMHASKYFDRTKDIERKASGRKLSRKEGHWTDAEHELFLACWSRNIRSWKELANIMKTRTNEQIRTHAQKYFSKLRELRYRGFDGDYNMNGKRNLTKTFMAKAPKGDPGKFTWQHMKDGRRQYRRRTTTGRPTSRLARSCSSSSASSSTSTASAHDVDQEQKASDDVKQSNEDDEMPTDEEEGEEGTSQPQHPPIFAESINSNDTNSHLHQHHHPNYHHQHNTEENDELHQEYFAMHIKDPISLLEANEFNTSRMTDPEDDGRSGAAAEHSTLAPATAGGNISSRCHHSLTSTAVCAITADTTTLPNHHHQHVEDDFDTAIQQIENNHMASGGGMMWETEHGLATIIDGIYQTPLVTSASTAATTTTSADMTRNSVHHHHPHYCQQQHQQGQQEMHAPAAMSRVNVEEGHQAEADHHHSPHPSYPYNVFV